MRLILVIRLALLVLSSLPLLAQDASLDKLLNDLEARYNSVRTLQVDYEETYKSAQGRRTEKGELFLRKPGRMRWQYSDPAGKLFISDGRQVYYYNPVTNRAERVKLKETEDMRAPLAFLLGRLDFQKDFTGFQAESAGTDTVVRANPKSDQLPYRQVEFTVSPLREIRRLVVTGHDNSVLTFDFINERMNPPLDNNLFKFRLPPGAEWVATADNGGR